MGKLPIADSDCRLPIADWGQQMVLLGEMTVLPLPGGGRIVMEKNPARVDAHGHCAAVALARAVYVAEQIRASRRPAEHGGVLLSLDSHTARFLFDKLLKGPLTAHRTVVRVPSGRSVYGIPASSDHVDLVLSGARYLVRMLDGRIDTQGAVEDLRAQGPRRSRAEDAGQTAQTRQGRASRGWRREVGDIQELPARLVLLDLGLLAFAVLVGQLLSVGEKLWIKLWRVQTWGQAYSDHNTTFMHYSYTSFATLDPEYPTESFSFAQVESRSRSTGLFNITWPSAQEHPLFYVGVYAGIGLAPHSQLLVSVVRATFRVHDTTPLGRMLNRFGLDMDKIDSDLAGSLQTVNSSLAGFFASVITTRTRIPFTARIILSHLPRAVFPGFLFPAIILGFIYYSLALGYLNTGRDLRRMESNSRSPIYSDFGELLEGIVTVRGMYSRHIYPPIFLNTVTAFSAENRFLDNLHKRINTATKMWMTTAGFSSTLTAWFAKLLAGGLAVFITALFSITIMPASPALPTKLDRSGGGLESDVPQALSSNRPPAYWPSSAANKSLLSVESLVVKGSPELPAVLQDVSFTLKAGERVGLIGRTGSGKSTLAMSILRFMDPASGRIVIDGSKIDINGSTLCSPNG
ncbi:hypothetical protein B0H10DRAFT_1953686 [Mycena sp. CBHHK59/15]|nr:hypothetical protein B0H10DRAFT_1953686 [Mycena sp. CBHHK59/15]